MDWFCNRAFLLVFTVGAVINSTLQDTKIEPVVPARVDVCSGSNATINCTFSAGSGHLKVKWLFNSTSSESFIDVHGEHYHHKHEETWSELTIIKVMLKDSGMYFCEVTQDIPRLVTSLSSGSQLNVIVRAVFRSADQDTRSEPLVPATVEVCSDAAVNCTFPTDFRGFKVKWFFKSDSSESMIDFHSEHYHHEHGETWSELTIKEVKFCDRGWYFCEVTQDIPEFGKCLSNEAQLNVIDLSFKTHQKHNTTPLKSLAVHGCVFTGSFCQASEAPQCVSAVWLIWSGSALALAVLVIATAVIWRMRRADPVYENIRTCAKKDCSPLLLMKMENSKASQETDTLKSHACHPKGEQVNPERI